MKSAGMLSPVFFLIRKEGGFYTIILIGNIFRFDRVWVA
jgi:hypothetical protein